MPDLPDPSDLLRGLDMLRSALIAPGQVGDSLPRALERAAEVTSAINRLTDEVAKLNAHAERVMPILESVDLQVQRAMPVIESFGVDKGFLSMRRSVRRAARDAEPADDGATKAPAVGEKPKSARRSAGNTPRTTTSRGARRPKQR